MPKNKYTEIYQDLKNKIEGDTYPYQEFLPSEHNLVQVYDCSRNTIRRALSQLVVDGYIQTIQGKGVRNIYRPVEQATFTLGEIESFQESALRNNHTARTEVLLFSELIVDEALSLRTSFPVGTEVFYIQRLHYLDDMPLILNHNYFLKDAMPDLTKDIAEASVYNYLEHTLHMTIVNSKRVMTVEKISEIDEKHMALNANEYNCVAVITSLTYNSEGIMFEYTQSRHRPDSFRFQDNAIRR